MAMDGGDAEAGLGLDADHGDAAKEQVVDVFVLWMDAATAGFHKGERSTGKRNFYGTHACFFVMRFVADYL